MERHTSILLAMTLMEPLPHRRDGSGILHTQAYGVSIGYTNFLKIRVPLVPPKPKELDIT